MEAPPEPRRALLRALPLAVLLPAAADTVLTRARLPHRPVEPALFGQSLLVWAALALIGLVPALLALRLVRWTRRAPAACLLFWTALPVAAHAQLDRYTSIGGDLSGLANARPWLEALAAAAALAALALLVEPVTRSRAARAGLLVLAVAGGLLLPPRPADGPPPAAPRAAAGRPNVLLLVWDTTRAHSLSLYGNPRDVSPGLADLARDALVFEEARSASVFTFSSHLSMLTGLFPSQHGGRLLRMRHDPERATSVARILNEAGYRTGAFVGTSVLAAHTGLDDGFEVYDDLVDPPVCDTHGWALVHDVQALLAAASPAFHASGRPHWFEDFQRPADGVLESAAEWIRSDDPRPWFCLVNLYDPHWPYQPGEGGRERWVAPYDGPMDGFASRSDELAGGYEATDEDERHLTELYEAEIWELDARVAGFLAALDPATDAVLVTSDHGEAFGEAGVWEHDDLYEPQVRVPFVLRLPGEDRPTGVVTGPVAGVDVAPTILAIAGLEEPEGLPGLDLTRERPEGDRLVLVEDRDLSDPEESRHALYRGRWKLEERRMDGELTVRLFDLSGDPVGEHDVSAQHPELVRELRERLDEMRAALAAGRTDDGEDGDGGASLEALRALGYLDD